MALPKEASLRDVEGDLLGHLGLRHGFASDRSPIRDSESWVFRSETRQLLFDRLGVDVPPLTELLKLGHQRYVGDTITYHVESRFNI